MVERKTVRERGVWERKEIEKCFEVGRLARVCFSFWFNLVAKKCFQEKT